MFITVLLLAASNGANDNFKGVATLYGSRTASHRTSLGWASITTLAGSLCSVFLARTLLKAFTGAGLVPPDIAAQTGFALAVAGGAGLTVAVAAWRGLPVSTTHALVGAMSGAGLVAVGMGVHFPSLGKIFLLPLLASPVIAIIPAFFIAPLLRRLVARAEHKRIDYLCIEQGAIATPDGVLMRDTAMLRVGSVAECADTGARTLLRCDARGVVDALFFLSGGAVSFARGLNDTPKIAALLLPIAMLDDRGRCWRWGGDACRWPARRAPRCAHDERQDHESGPGRRARRQPDHQPAGQHRKYQWPSGIDHACLGRAMVGAGSTGQSGVNRKVINGIVMSWVATLPIGALFGAMLYGWVR